MSEYLVSTNENKNKYKKGKIPSKKPNKIKKLLNSEKVAPYVFVLPFILSFLVLTLYPAIKAIIMSFQRVLPGQNTFIGLANYKNVMNPTFYRALQNTSLYVIFTVIILTIVPLLLAVLLNSTLIKYKMFFRASLFIPALASVIVAGITFRLIFGESDSSAANQFISILGMDAIDWRYNSWSAIFLMVLLASWRWMGVNILYFLAALQTIPNELYEASDIDGANQSRKFFHITLPQIKPIIIFVVTISIINGFRLFEESFVFWETNSPGDIGLSVIGFIYQQGIEQNDLGLASAAGVVLMVIIFIISIVQLSVTGAFKKE